MTPGTDQIIHLRSSIPERNQRVVAPPCDSAYALEAKAFGGHAHSIYVFSQVMHSHCSAQAVDDSSGRAIGGRFTPLPPASFCAYPKNRVPSRTIVEAT